MNKELNRKRRKFENRTVKENNTASDSFESAGGDYFCDYSPRYQEIYSIYDKAKIHAKQIRKKTKKT